MGTGSALAGERGLASMLAWWWAATWSWLQTLARGGRPVPPHHPLGQRREGPNRERPRRSAWGPRWPRRARGCGGSWACGPRSRPRCRWSCSEACASRAGRVGRLRPGGARPGRAPGHLSSAWSPASPSAASRLPGSLPRARTRIAISSSPWQAQAPTGGDRVRPAGTWELLRHPWRLTGKPRPRERRGSRCGPISLAPRRGSFCGERSTSRGQFRVAGRGAPAGPGRPAVVGADQGAPSSSRGMRTPRAPTRPT